MRMMRSIGLMLAALLALGGVLRAQTPAQTPGQAPSTEGAVSTVSAVSPASAAAARDQIAAATGRALDALRAQIAAESIGTGLTVQDLLDKTRSTKTLMKTLRRAQQIGGPRWLDPQTCQVRLEIGGPMIAKALVVIAASDNRTPIDPRALQFHLQSWDRRTFSATGTSTGAAAVESGLADAVHRQAVCDARQDAVRQVLQNVRPIPLAKGKTVADALANPAVRDEVEKWLNARPVTQIEFRDEAQQQARVTLAVSGDEFFDAFRAAAQKQASALPPMDESAWGRVRDEFIARVGPAAGRAMAKPDANPQAAPLVKPVVLPQAPPDWVNQQVEAQGVSSARAGGSRLKTARAAESDAGNKLRDKIQGLGISPGLTLGDAARQDKRIAQGVERALARAATTKVDYRPDGGAVATVTLDLRDVWQEIAPP